MFTASRVRRWVAVAVPAIAICLLAGTASTPVSAATATSRPAIRGAGSAAAVPGKYIVVLKHTASVQQTGIAARAQNLTQAHKGTLRYVYDSVLHGFAAAMSEAEALNLAADPDVDYVEQDQTWHLTDTQDNPPAWGLDRIDQRALPLDTMYTYDSTASNVHAYVIDTGIRISHNDFGGRAGYGWNFYDNNPIADDCFTDINGNPLGHGTHVAGILGSSTYGVAKGVRLVAVKIFGCSGTTDASTIAAGIDWVTAHAIKPAVINMSVGQSCDPAHPCTDDDLNAVAKAMNDSIDSGLTYVVSAGNDNVDTCTGLVSRTPRAITVGATDINDRPASYSNWGRCVNVWAPGGDQNGGTAGILSLNRTNDTATMTISGTSMAAPHVAGVVAQILARPGWDTATPDKISNELLNTMATSGAVIDPVAAHMSTTKLLYNAPPPVAGGSSIAAARNNDGSLDLFGVNRAGTLMYRTQALGSVNTWSGWTQSVNPEWASPAAQTDKNGKIDLLGLRKTAQNTWHRSQTQVNCSCWTAWSSFDHPLNSSAVALGSTGDLEYFGTDNQGQVWHRSQTNFNGVVGYTPWQQFPLPIVARMRSVAADTNEAGLVELFALTSAGQVWHRWETSVGSGTYTPWLQLDGTRSAIAVARHKNGRLELFGTDSAGQAYHRSAAAGTNNWFSWSPLDQPAALGPLASVAAEANADGRVEVFSVGRDGKLWHRWQDSADSDTYAPWVQLDGTLRP